MTAVFEPVGDVRGETAARVRIESIEQVLLLAMFVAVLALPRNIPGLPVNVTTHGLLLAAVGILVLTRRRKARSFAYIWPFAGVVAAFALSAVAAEGPLSFGSLRIALFGVLTAFVTGVVLDTPRAVASSFKVLGAAAAATAVLLTSLFFGSVNLTMREMLDATHLWLGSSFDHGVYLLVGLVAFWLLGSGSWFLPTMGVVPVLFAATVLTAARSLWLGTVFAFLVFFGLTRQVLRSTVVVVVAALAFVSIRHQSDRLVNAADTERQQIVRAQQAQQEEERQHTAIGGTVSPAGSPAGVAPTARSASAVSTVTPTPRQAGSPLPARTIMPTDVVSVATAGDVLVKTSTSSGKFREELTSAGRLGLWRAGLRMWWDNPILGVGPTNFSRFSRSYASRETGSRDSETNFDAHSMFVTILAETGVVGAVAVGALIVVALLQWWSAWQRMPQERVLLAAVAAAFVGMSVVGLTWDIHVKRMWWIALGLVYGASSHADR
jgi:hypothetical protein